MDAREIGQMEALCIQDEPAYCTAGCPVHVDVRLMLTHIQKGNFEKALKSYGKQVLFPSIISRVCDEPCKASCIRQRIDEPIAIRRLEKACVDYAAPLDGAVFAAPQKDKRVAVIGGGLSGLSCALELTNKGYNVTVFEKTGRLGGRLWDIDPLVLPPAVIIDSLASVEAAGAEIRLDSTVSHMTGFEYDAIYVATGVQGDTFRLERERDGKIIFNPVSLVSARDGIFVGGCLLAAEGDRYSPIAAISHGLRASRSIDRYLKRVSLTSGREKEVSCSTHLYTEIRGRESKPVVAAGGSSGEYSETEAREEAGRCLQCECMECVKACPFLKFYNEYPKQYVKHISKSLNVIPNLGTRFATRLLNSCSLCGLCQETCVTGFDMGLACQEARRRMVEAGDMPPAFHDFFLRDMAFADSEQAFFVRNQPGAQASSYLFFPGCQLGASAPDNIGKTYRYLIDRLEGGVGLMTGCCGAPAAWAGRKELHEERLQVLRNHWDALGRPEVLVACPTCKKMFNEYLSDVPVRTLWTVMAEMGLPAEAKCGDGQPLAVYDPCSSRYDASTQRSVRTMLQALAWQINELPLAGKYAQCCSYGGLIAAVNPQLASQITHQRMNASPHPYVTYCSNCRDDFAAKGKPIWHLLDVLFGDASEAAAKRKPPTRSERRENRRRLKADLLKTVWGETIAMEQQEYEKLRLVMSAAVRKKMDMELVLADEVRQVIYSAEQSGDKILDGETGHFVAYARLGIITYWVEYTPRCDAYEVFNVYSHRMQILGEGQ